MSMTYAWAETGHPNCRRPDKVIDGRHYYQMHHLPNNLIFRILYLIGAPLFLIPRFRDNLVVVAYAPLHSSD